MARRWRLKRVLLYGLIGALVFCAVLGIYAFIFGQFGQTEVKILVTTLGVCFYSLTAMACLAALESRRSRILSLPGLGACAAGMLVLLGAIWLEGYQDEGALKIVAILAMSSFSFAQASLLSLAHLESRLAWVSWIAYGAIFWLVIQLSVMIVWEIDDEWLFRGAGVLGILDGCASLTIPILYKLRGGRKPAAVEQAYSHIELTCPRCGHHDKLPVGSINCPQCALRIRVEVRATSEAAENPPFQFSLRSLMLVTLIVAVALSLFATRLQRLRAELRITEPLRRIGAYTVLEHGNAVAVTFPRRSGKLINDEHLSLLAGLPHLRRLSFEDVPIVDRQLALLKGLELDALDLQGTLVTDAGLEHLQGLTSLRNLDLTRTRVGDQAVEELQRELPDCTILH